MPVVKVFLKPPVLTEMSGANLQDRLRALGVIPEHFGSFDTLVDLLDQ